MKLIYLIPFLFISTLTAQNWSPVNLHDVYNYKSDSTGLITHSIWVDSVKVQGGDSVFYLNRVVTKCDTCVNINTDPWVEFVLYNQPQFLQRKVRKTAPGIYQLENPDTLLVHAFARLNDTWMFDAVNQVTVTVTFVGTMPFLGATDSAKVFTLSNGQSIVLSQNHGALSYPKDSTGNQFELIGIEGSHQIGERIPGPKDFFDFNVGDVFQYELGEYNWGLPMHKGGYSLVKEKILSKQISGDTMTYTVERYTRKWDQSFFGGLVMDTIGPELGGWRSVLSVNYIDVPGAIPNGYPNQLLEAAYIPHQQPLGGLTTAVMDVDSNGNKIKFFGALGTLSDYTGLPDSLSQDLLLLSPHPNESRFFSIYQQGLGMISAENTYFEGSYIKRLIGYTKGSNTIGTVYADNYLSAVDPNKEGSLDIDIFPNPTSGSVYFSINDAASHPANFRVYSLKGENLVTHSYPLGTREFSIDLSDHTPGIYMISVEQNGKYHFHRILVKK